MKKKSLLKVKENKESGISRRKFLGSTAALAGGVLLRPLSPGASAYVAGSDVLKLALVGSGARGAGAVRAGKHVFMEKPLASDAPGIRKILAAGKEADRKGLKVVVGLQNRYGYRQNELIKRIHDGTTRIQMIQALSR